MQYIWKNSGKKLQANKCQICFRDIPDEYLEKHHLIPKSKKGKDTIDVCNACDDQLHLLFTNKELAKQYNTLDKLLSSEKVLTWVNWIRNRPRMYTVCNKKMKKDDLKLYILLN